MMYTCLDAQLFLEVNDLLFGQSSDLGVLLVKVTSERRVVNLNKPVWQESGYEYAYVKECMCVCVVQIC